MEECKYSRFGVVVLFFLLYHHSFISMSSSLNHEGMVLLKLRERVVEDPYGALEDWKYNELELTDPCSWFGVECSDDRRVVALNLKGLCLRGTLAPELKNLIYLKSIILRNNSFYGVIPREIAELRELEVLDLGWNNFSGSIPFDLGSNLSMSILLLDNNELLESLSPEIQHLKMISESQVDENDLSSSSKGSPCAKRSITQKVQLSENAVHHRQLQEQPPLSASPPSPFRNPFSSVRMPPPSSRTFQPNITRPSPRTSPPPKDSDLPPPPVPNVPTPAVNGSSPPLPTPSSSNSSDKKSNAGPIIGGTVGGILFFLAIIGLYVWKFRKAPIKPWATGLSGQLQKAFVTGVPKLKRSELEAACEDFSNVIGSSSLGTLYKGTLSSGVEIAVASVASPSAKDWSRNLEVQFRNKIETLSKVNHKNFINLIGYCKEQKPLTRMMVFEYAPNGTLFEHLHIKESEHLNWAMRLRIMMGVVYCLEHMHQLNPQLAHNNLTSSAVHLTEDYAAKVSDFSFSTDSVANDMESSSDKLSESLLGRLERNVYSFGVLLFEIITGRLPYSAGDGSIEDWASDYLNGEQALREIVDPTLNSFEEGKIERIDQVIKSCVCPDPSQRPTMREVRERLKEIIAITPDAATPKLSPLWWAELELSTVDAS